MSFTDSISVIQPLLHPGIYCEAGEQGKKLVDPVFETSRFGMQPPLHTAVAGELTQRALAAGQGSPRIVHQALPEHIARSIKLRKCERKVFFDVTRDYANEQLFKAFMKNRQCLDEQGRPAIRKNNTEKLAQELDRLIDRLHRRIHRILGKKGLAYDYTARAGVETGKIGARLAMPDHDVGRAAGDACAGLSMAMDPLLFVIAAGSTDALTHTLAGKYRARRQLVQNLEGMQRYLKAPAKACAADARAYLLALDAAQNIPALNRKLKHAFRRVEAAFLRECPLQAAGLALAHTRDIGLMAGTVTGVAAASLNAAVGLVGIGSGAADIADARSSYKQSQHRIGANRATAARLQHLFEGNRGEQDGQVAAPSLSEDASYKNIHQKVRHQQARIERQEKKAQRFSIGRAVRGGLGATVGAASTSLAIAGATGAVAVAGAATGGIVLGVTAAALGLVYAAGSACKYRAAWKEEHRSKWRQREAQYIIGTHTPEQLRAMFEQKKSLFIWMGRGKYTAQGYTDLRRRTIDIADNEYIALHLLAGDFLNLVRGQDMQGRGYMVCEFLKALGIDELSINAHFIMLRELLACARPEEELLDQVKGSIAPYFGLAFRTDAGGREAAPTPGMYFDAFRRTLMDLKVSALQIDYGLTGTVDPHGRDKPHRSSFSTIAAHFFEQVDPDGFIAATQTIALVTGPGELERAATPHLQFFNALQAFANHAERHKENLLLGKQRRQQAYRPDVSFEKLSWIAA